MLLCPWRGNSLRKYFMNAPVGTDSVECVKLVADGFLGFLSDWERLYAIEQCRLRVPAATVSTQIKKLRKYREFAELWGEGDWFELTDTEWAAAYVLLDNGSSVKTVVDDLKVAKKTKALAVEAIARTTKRSRSGSKRSAP